MQLSTANNCLNAMYFLTWIICSFMHDMTYLDYLWGLGFAAQGLIYYKNSIDYSIWDMFKTFSLHPGKMSFEKFTFTFLILAHSIRQVAYLVFRKGSEEDIRYREFRNKTGQHAWWLSYFSKFLPQVFANLLIGLCIYEFNNASAANICHIRYWLGIATMIMGSVMETIADVQLYNFKNSKRMEGKVLDTGLWKYCRHPNYFGEILFFTGAFICNLSIGKYYTIMCPLIDYIMIRYVSGVPTLEKYLLEKGGQRFQEYMNRTPCLCPLAFPFETKKSLEKVTPNEKTIPHTPQKQPTAH
jgi:steroid 5-alpha reductase family enzyme